VKTAFLAIQAVNHRRQLKRSQKEKGQKSEK
jgi:hypothetical protein